MADHLSRIVQGEDEEAVSDAFPEEHLYHLGESTRPIRWVAVLALTGPEESEKRKGKPNDEPWFADLANYLVTGELPAAQEITRAQRMKIKSESKYYFWDDPYLWKMGSDQVIRMCIPECEQRDVLN